MPKKVDFAQMRHMESWLRHPVLGDPSFDNFQKIYDTVHRSQPPFEWAVNGSIFSDPKTGVWYYYVACYPRGYWEPSENLSHFLIYRSKDKGQTWENLGRGFPDLSCPFVGMEDVHMCAPDAVVFYDAESDKYWLTYDWGAGKLSGQGDSFSVELLPDAGVALAWAERPEGPFHKLDTWVHNNRFGTSRIGRFNRGYSSSTFKRKNDWICFIMQDSGPCFGWGLTCRTAKSPEGPWSEPRLILSPDRPGYYPEIVEFCFCVERDGTIYAPATSVAGNRNYQVVFAADLEEAEHPSAWKMIREGSLWHARPLADERYGIWGQTLQGFVENGNYYTMYVGMDDRTCGTLSVASCPVDQPFKDGFTISGHVSKSISPILAAYKDYGLDMQLTFTGTVEVFLKYRGIMGPNVCTSNALTDEESFVESLSVELQENRQWRILLRNAAGELRVLGSGTTNDPIQWLQASWQQGVLAVTINGQSSFRGDLRGILEERSADAELFCQTPLAVCAHEVSILNCSRFEVEGEPLPYTLRYSARDAVLTAMHKLDWQPTEDYDFLTRKGYVGRREQWVKWNIRGDGFRIWAPRGPELGVAEIWVDGYLYATVDLFAEEKEPSSVVFRQLGIPGEKRHAVVIKGYEGQSFAVDTLEVTAPPQV